MEDLESAFRLTMNSYYRAGLSCENPSGLRLTPYHLLPTSDVIVAETGGIIHSTLSLFADGELGLPMESIYGGEIRDLRRSGLRLAELGGLADRRNSTSRFIHTFADISKLMVQVAMARNVDALVAAVHPKHARLYKRLVGFKQIGELTLCPYANRNPAVLIFLRFEDYLGTDLYERYLGTQIPEEQLRPFVWTEDAKSYFQRILEKDGQIAQVINIENYHHWFGAPDFEQLDLSLPRQQQFG